MNVAKKISTTAVAFPCQFVDAYPLVSALPSAHLVLSGIVGGCGEVFAVREGFAVPGRFDAALFHNGLTDQAAVYGSDVGKKSVVLISDPLGGICCQEDLLSVQVDGRFGSAAFDQRVAFDAFRGVDSNEPNTGAGAVAAHPNGATIDNLLNREGAGGPASVVAVFVN